VAIPLVPALTPGWPRSGALAPLVLAIPLTAYGVVRARRGTLTPAVLLLAAAFPLYALHTGNAVNLTTGDNAATRVLPSLLSVTRRRSAAAPSSSRPRTWLSTATLSAPTAR